MSNYRYIIFSRGRSNNVKTLKSFPLSMMNRVWLVVYENELQDYKDNYGHLGCNIIASPAGVKGLVERRKWATHNLSNNGVMFQLEDDVGFSQALTINKRNGLFRFKATSTMDEAGKEKAMNEMEEFVQLSIDNGFSVGSFFPGTSPNSVDGSVSFQRRMMWAWWIDHSVIKPETLTWKDLISCDDFWLNCELATMGYVQSIYGKMAVNSREMASTPGGLNAYRDLQSHNASLEELKADWPEIVQLKVKNTGHKLGEGALAATLRLSKVRTEANLQQMDNFFKLYTGVSRKEALKIQRVVEQGNGLEITSFAGLEVTE